MDRPADHTGVITVVLVAAPVAVALYLSLLYRLGVPATVVTTLLSGGAPAGVYLGWASYRNSRPDPAGKRSLAAVVDDLAGAIRRQWDEEARVRRLYDPYPLPVSWVPADGSLVDPWDVLVEQAANAGPGRASAGAGTWAAGPDELEGKGSELSDVLLRVPTGRLVVLGAPGAGKTVLMVRLVRDLLERRVGGGQVPVLVPLASWDPAKQGLREWLTAQLTIDYPALAVQAPPGLGTVPLSAALLDAGLLLPVLDGLDEVPDRSRGQAIAKINAALLPGSQVVVTCRKQEYAEAISAPGGER